MLEKASMGRRLGAALVVAIALCGLAAMRGDARGTELLGTWEVPTGIGIDREPYSAPPTLWLYWGSTTNRRMEGSGENIRHLFKLGRIEGGEYRDPQFLHKIDGVLFKQLSTACCTSLVMPPFEWDFPVHNANKAVGQALRSYVANGNALIMTGGLIDIEFLNRYFSLNLEPADGNYAPGPFPLLPNLHGYSDKMKALVMAGPSVLPQKGIAVTAVKRDSLPDGSTIIYASPKNVAVFTIKFCMAENPKSESTAPLPPIRVYPKYCPASARAGRPCSCGNIAFLGYNYRDRYPSRWDLTLKIMERVASITPEESKDPANYHPKGTMSEGDEENAKLDSAQARGDSQEKLVEKWPESGKLVDNPNGGSFKAAQQAMLRHLGKMRQQSLAQGTAGHRISGARGRASKRAGGETQHTDAAKATGCGPICQLRNLVTNMKAGQ